MKTLAPEQIDNIMVFLNRSSKTGAESDVLEKIKVTLAEIHAEQINIRVAEKELAEKTRLENEHET